MSRQRSPLLPIFLIVLVDVLGFTIVIPLLPLYALNFESSKLVATTLTSVYAFCSLISTPIIGNLSDKLGRKRLLIASQIGTCGGFIILAFSNALWMVFLGRIIDGITAGNLSLAQAYISDHTKAENRAKSFGIIGIAFGVGFMFGPGIGGFLAKYGLHVPFIAAASLSLLSILCTSLLLTNEIPPQHDPAAAAAAPAGPGGKRPGAFDLAVYFDYFRRPGLGKLYLQFFLFTFAFSCFTSGMAIFALEVFGWGVTETGYLFMLSGFLGIIWQGGLIGRMVKKYGERKLALAGFVSAVVAYLLISSSVYIGVVMIFPAALVASFGNGVLRPVLTSLITQSVGRHEQGTALGISGSLSSMAMVLAPVSGGALLEANLPALWPIVSATTIVAALFVALARPEPADTVTTP